MLNYSIAKNSLSSFLSVSDGAAEQIGYAIGVVITTVILLGIPTLFVISLIKSIRSKSKGWIITAVITGAFCLVPVGLFFYGMYQGIQKFDNASERNIDAGTSMNVVSVDSLCQLTIPKHWEILTDLNNSASLQAGNLSREEYLIVISDAKVDFVGSLEEHSQVTSKNLTSTLADATSSDVSELEINGYKALQNTVSGAIDHTNIIYLKTNIEGDKAYYQILTWTLPSKKAEAFKVFQDVLETFVELN